MVNATQATATAPKQGTTPQPQRPSSQAAAQGSQAPPATTGVPADLGETIDRAVNAAIQAATQGAAQGATSAERARATREQVNAAMDQLRAELAARRGTQPAVVQVPSFPADMIPPQAVTISVAFFAMIAFIAVGIPIARAWARRMDRKGQAAPVAQDLAPRLDRIEQAVEAVAIEVERVSEGQRYTTKVLAELRALPAPNPLAAWPDRAGQGAAVPVSSGERDRP